MRKKYFQKEIFDARLRICWRRRRQEDHMTFTDCLDEFKSELKLYAACKSLANSEPLF